MILGSDGVLRHAAWSDEPGLVHGVTTRQADPGIETRLSLARVRQVHGCGVAIATAPERKTREGDAVLTATPGVLAAVSTADCLPVLLFSRNGSRPVVAAVHCGWRGLRARVIAEAIRTLGERFRVRPETLSAAFGPAIEARCYEVGAEVEVPFMERSIESRDGRLCLSLALEARLQLEAEGVPSSRIIDDSPCTRCDSALFHSYRRDGVRTGRMINFIGWAGGGSQ